MGKKLSKEEIERVKANPDLMALTDDLDKITAIGVVSKTEGGKILVEGLLTDIVSSVDTIANKHSTLTANEFITIGASIKTKLDLVRVMTKADKNKEELTEMLKEALQD